MPAPDPQSILDGNRRALAKAITLTESSLGAHREESQRLLEALLPHTGNSIRIGISGVPGVGKSTFIESFGQLLLKAGKRLAVLAVDPSSPVAGGSIMGDKTRMEQLSREENVFIRPTPSGGTLGGVAQKTRETMLLCEAAGYDVIIVETVGVGQSEFQVAGMVDFFMLLMLPGGGDELQGIKKGIVELADALVINKSDGEGAGIAAATQTQYQSAFSLLRNESHWTPVVMRCSALANTGLGEVWDTIQSYVASTRESGFFERQRATQNRQWMQQLVQSLLMQRLKESPSVAAALPKLEMDVESQTITPYAAARRVIELMDEG
ncbi:methylmalonyl Co-A mutase-associated GTPase MeaB [Congregibacter litoralis]|uniref:Methylmalonyl-CoA mutase metallochaperone MeaB n=1 Tax=Congregibacter litoralis KT71 TaxID=314285 RepID=A4A3C6_9GAMM|nr:methylmalonyl Co-A mutase-associated GTPase MeaB [Congregibacter litoralis]EAQ99199.1 methylmalonyl-CoA mutase metallochaperone MeaB [Congregibacter litoralis KT71]